jgi:poly(A) polymerase
MTRKPRDAWQAAIETIRKLRAEGHIALLAGGCVRDRLLNRVPKDYDIVTDAVPARVHEIFPRARKVGAKFGVMLVRRFGHDIEVATFRADGPYTDGRHPNNITFGSDIEDARRRDFTINGLFLDPIDDRIIDYINGRADLEAGIVRTSGDPDRRFTEDHLRMLRAIRFAARLGFTIASATADSIKRHARHLATISTERVWIELEMILTDPTRSRGWSLLVETGLRDHLSPAWPRLPESDSMVAARYAALPAHPIAASLALAVALHGLKPDEAARVCQVLRLSNELRKAVVWLIDSLPTVRDDQGLDLADLKLLMAEGAWPELLELLRADLIATGMSQGPFERLTARAASIPPERVTPPPLVTGDTLAELGMEPGPRMGEILKAVYREQLNERITTPEQAKTMARRLMDV